MLDIFLANYPCYSDLSKIGFYGGLKNFHLDLTNLQKYDCILVFNEDKLLYKCPVKDFENDRFFATLDYYFDYFYRDEQLKLF